MPTHIPLSWSTNYSDDRINYGYDVGSVYQYYNARTNEMDKMTIVLTEKISDVFRRAKELGQDTIVLYKTYHDDFKVINLTMSTQTLTLLHPIEKTFKYELNNNNMIIIQFDY